MRAYLENGMMAQPQPIKLYYYGSFFRHENPQKGRYREFKQFGIEMIGSPKSVSDATIIYLMAMILREVGIENIVIDVNSIGDKESRTPYIRELTTQPVITGQAPPNTKIRIEIHSDEAIVTQVTTDANGGFEVQLEELKKTLSPGEHTVTITYTDPRTGQEVTETRTFTVESPPSGGGSLLAMASPSPYGTGNPYASPSPSPSPSASATGSSKTAGMPSTRSAQPVSGTFDFTLSLLFMGGLFIAGGWWSYRASKHWLTTEES
jgi:hypothetical protein